MSPTVFVIVCMYCGAEMYSQGRFEQITTFCTGARAISAWLCILRSARESLGKLSDLQKDKGIDNLLQPESALKTFKALCLTSREIGKVNVSSHIIMITI